MQGLNHTLHSVVFSAWPRKARAGPTSFEQTTRARAGRELGTRARRLLNYIVGVNILVGVQGVTGKVKGDLSSV